MVLNVPRASSFPSTQFFYLNLGCWYVVLSTNLSFSNIALLYYYINLRLPINFSLSSGDIYLSLGIYLSLSFVTVSELLFGETSEIFVTLSAILLPIKSLLVYAALLFETVLNASVTQRAHHVKSRSIRRGYYVYTSKTKFRRISTLSPRTFFEKISLFQISILFPSTFFNVISMIKKSTLFPFTSFFRRNFVGPKVLVVSTYFFISTLIWWGKNQPHFTVLFPT